MILDLVAQRLWEARRQGALAGVAYTLVMVGLIWVATGGLIPQSGVSLVALIAFAAVALDCYRRLFRRP